MSLLEDDRYIKFGARCVFFDRFGGVSQRPFNSLNVSLSVGDSIHNVNQNLDIIKKILNVKEIGLINQVHSDSILEYNGLIVDADGFFTAKNGIFLGIKFADCCPVVFMDTKKGFIGSVHSGWRGAQLEIAQKMLKQFYSIGSSSNDIIATLGPHICGSCYEVKADVASQFDKKYIKAKDGKLFLSLKESIIDSLVNIGLKVSNIFDFEVCTYENENFFSYRRERITGRNLGGIFLLEN